MYTNHFLGLFQANHINIFALLALGDFQVQMIEVGSKYSFASLPVLVLMCASLDLTVRVNGSEFLYHEVFSGSSSAKYLCKTFYLANQLFRM